MGQNQRRARIRTKKRCITISERKLLTSPLKIRGSSRTTQSIKFKRHPRIWRNHRSQQVSHTRRQTARPLREKQENRLRSRLDQRIITRKVSFKGKAINNQCKVPTVKTNPSLLTNTINLCNSCWKVRKSKLGPGWITRAVEREQSLTQQVRPLVALIRRKIKNS